MSLRAVSTRGSSRVPNGRVTGASASATGGKRRCHCANTCTLGLPVLINVSSFASGAAVSVPHEGRRGIVRYHHITTWPSCGAHTTGDETWYGGLPVGLEPVPRRFTDHLLVRRLGGACPVAMRHALLAVVAASFKLRSARRSVCSHGLPIVNRDMRYCWLRGVSLGSIGAHSCVQIHRAGSVAAAAAGAGAAVERRPEWASEWPSPPSR